MIKTAEGAALVKGVAPNQPKLVKVTVTRAFCMKGQRLESGAALEVPEVLARQLMSDGKAAPFIETAPAKSAPASGADKPKPTTKGS